MANWYYYLYDRNLVLLIKYSQKQNIALPNAPDQRRGLQARPAKRQNYPA
jgi:hypothetical protein